MKENPAGFHSCSPQKNLRVRTQKGATQSFPLSSLENTKLQLSQIVEASESNSCCTWCPQYMGHASRMRNPEQTLNLLERLLGQQPAKQNGCNIEEKDAVTALPLVRKKKLLILCILESHFLIKLCECRFTKATALTDCKRFVQWLS